jgi:hypothetical protein
MSTDEVPKDPWLAPSNPIFALLIVFSYLSMSNLVENIGTGRDDVSSLNRITVSKRSAAFHPLWGIYRKGDYKTGAEAMIIVEQKVLNCEPQTQ